MKKLLFVIAALLSVNGISHSTLYPDAKCESVYLESTGCHHPACFAWDTSGCYIYWHSGIPGQGNYTCHGNYKCAKAKALYDIVIYICLDGGPGCDGTPVLHNLGNRYEGTGPCVGDPNGVGCTGIPAYPGEWGCVCNNIITFNCSGYLC